MNRFLLLPLLCCAFIVGCAETQPKKKKPAAPRFGMVDDPVEPVPAPVEPVAPVEPMPTVNVPPPSAPATQLPPPSRPPVGIPVPGKPGLVTSPFSNSHIIDVRGYAPGEEARDPWTQQIFLVP